MATKNLSGRFLLKKDTSANWQSHSSFVPLEGEIIYYSDIHDIKIGDGVQNISQLSFISLGNRYLNRSELAEITYHGEIQRPVYDYTQSGPEVTLRNAPHSQSGDTVTIL